MTKSQFDKIFKECENSLDSKSVEDIAGKIELFANGKETISDTELAFFPYIESINYSKELIYSLFLKVLELKD